MGDQYIGTPPRFVHLGYKLKIMSALTIENELATIQIVHQTKLNNMSMEERVVLMYRLQQLLLANNTL